MKQAIYNVFFRNSIGDETSSTFLTKECNVLSLARLYSQQNPIIGVPVRYEYVREYEEPKYVSLNESKVLCSFIAKFSNDVCPKCGEDVLAGESVKWTDTHRNKLMHASCEAASKPIIPSEVENELSEVFLRGELYADVRDPYQQDGTFDDPRYDG